MDGKRTDRNNLLRLSIGAGLLGGAVLALRYAGRPLVRRPLPDAISPAEFATRVFESSRGDIIYHEAGEGRPVVFIHSVCVGGSSYEWSKVYPTFADRHRVLALDLIGFGESSRPGGTMTVSDHVQSLAEFLLNTCPNEAPIIVASGLGAGFAVLLASQHPDLVSRLCLAMPTGLSEFGRTRLTYRASLLGRLPWVNDFAYRNLFSRTATIRRWLQEFAFADPELVTDEIVQIFNSCARQYGAEHAIHNLTAGRFHFDLESRLATLSQPVRLIWGEQAAFPPLEWAKRFRGIIPACSLTVLHNAGILAALEAPEAMGSVLAQEFEDTLRVYKVG